MSYVFTSEQKEWLAALRSGKYSQTTLGNLKDELGYCCLGVACEIFKERLNLKVSHPTRIIESEIHPEFDREVDDEEISHYDGCDESAPKPVVDLLKLNGSLGEFTAGFTPEISPDIRLFSPSLAGLNDSGKFNFNAIVDFIESNPEKVFRS